VHLSFVVFETIKRLVDEATTLFRAGGCSIYFYQITKYFCNQPKASLRTFCIIQKLDRESSLVRCASPTLVLECYGLLPKYSTSLSPFGYQCKGLVLSNADSIFFRFWVCPGAGAFELCLRPSLVPFPFAMNLLSFVQKRKEKDQRRFYPVALQILQSHAKATPTWNWTGSSHQDKIYIWELGEQCTRSSLSLPKIKPPIEHAVARH
jgi:hypothetical protein